MAPSAAFDLALRIRRDSAPIGEVMSFLSALYFRGKLTYAQRFATPPTGCTGVLVITPDRGLVSPETVIGFDDVHAFGRVPIDAGEPRYVAPFRAAAKCLRRRLPANAEIVLLGSIATPKYVDVLLAVFGSSLLFPVDFVGRGDMSRGGLLLRAARSGVQLEYHAIDGAKRRGHRPSKLPAPSGPSS